MSGDIFSRTTDAFGGSMSADSARITFPAIIGGGADAGFLTQTMGLQYTQQVSRVFEIGSPNVYLVGGRTAGNASLGRVIGPRKITKEFYQTYGDVCHARTNTLHFSLQAGCGIDQELAKVAYTCHFVVVQSIGISLSAQDMLINEQLALMFSSFLYD